MPFSRFEKLAQHLFEDSLRRIFGGRLQAEDVAVRLARAAEKAYHEGTAVSGFRVLLNPDDYTAVLNRDPEAAVHLSAHVQEAARQAGVPLPAGLAVRLRPSEAVHAHQVAIQPEAIPNDEQTPTRVFSGNGRDKNGALAAIHALNAFFVINGREHVEIDQPLITIGRRFDNDIVLEAATVSRQHAQIRWRYGRFVLFAVSQRGQTAVNGRRVFEHVLQPGDVINLGHVRLIYGESPVDDREETAGGN